MPSTQPNIVLFFTDQLRADALGCYGNQICKTPNIDRLATQGVIFNNAYTTSPVCSPSRASLMTSSLVFYGTHEQELTATPVNECLTCDLTGFNVIHVFLPLSFGYPSVMRVKLKVDFLNVSSFHVFLVRGFMQSVIYIYI